MQPNRSYLAALLLTSILPGYAQSPTAQPVLHRRTYQESAIDLGTRSTGRTTLPEDVSGEYMLGSGGTIDVEVQPDRLTGFITRLGDHESDEGASLTFFFSTSRMSGEQLAFATRQVHGVWFSFQGTIIRGPAQSRSQQGYYLLEGDLVMHDTVSQTQQTRRVSLPMARQSTIG